MIGFGGGTILIGVLLLFLPPAAVIPLHGMVQLFSNSWRVFLFRRHIGWHLVWRFILLMPFGIVVGLWFFQGLSKEAIQIFIGLVVLFSLFTRRLKRFRDSDLPLGAFVPLGFVVGILNMMVGVVAPLMGVLVVRKELNKEQVIGTLGFFAMAGHILKVGAFGLVGFRFQDHLPALAVLIPGVMLGGVVGKWMLGRFNERFFMVAFQGLLVLLSFKLIVVEGLLKLF
jgi:uncharacterized membrane protein YfcA